MDEEYLEDLGLVDDEPIDQGFVHHASAASAPAKAARTENVKLTELPLARVKRIMKTNPDCNLITKEAILIVTKSSELFLGLLAKELKKTTLASKKKIVKMKDLDTVLDSASNLCFLDGMLN